MQEFETALGYDDIQLLPAFSDIASRKDVSIKSILSRGIELEFPIVLSPMDTVSTVDACAAMNQIGAAGILHRFMPIEEQVSKIKQIKDRSGKAYAAIGLKDAKERVPALLNAGVDLLFLDTANGLARVVYTFTKEFKLNNKNKQLVVGNTLTKESVSRLINVGADGVRHLIGPGSMCITQLQTGVGCPSVTGNYYAWKAIRNWELYNHDWDESTQKDWPSVLTDGGIRYPKDLCKAIASGANAVICGKVFAGCRENTNPDNIIEKDGKKFVVYRGMASKAVVEDYKLSDGTKKNLFVEGEVTLLPYQDKSVTDIVYEFTNGLRSCMSYLGIRELKQMVGGLWNGKINAVRVTANSIYEGFPHGKQ
jgi:IMP dehydrogenase